MSLSKSTHKPGFRPKRTNFSSGVSDGHQVDSVHPETPGQIPRPARFPFGKEAFFVLARTVWRLTISGLPSAAPKGGAYSLVPRHFRIAQRRTERCKEIDGLRGGVPMYAAQENPKIDAARAEKGTFLMETN